jgi:bla regulator protein blaR1
MEVLKELLSENITEAIGWTVLHSLWQAPAAALVLSLILRARSGLPARKRYLLGYGALVSVLLMALATFAWYYRPLPVLEPGATPLYIYAAAPTEIYSPAAEGFWDSVSDRLSAQLPLIVVVWLTGLAFFLLRLAGGVWYAERLKYKATTELPASFQQLVTRLARKTGVKRAVRVLESALLQTPVVVGWLKPVILLPVGMVNRLSPEQTEAILAHELAHICRHDYLLNLLQSCIEALFYFNPAVWHISALVRAEREHSCDDTAVRVCGNSLAYAKALVQLQEMSRPAPALAMALHNGKGALLHRIQRILHPTIKSSSDIMEKITVTGLLLAAVFAFTLQASSVAAAPENFDPAIVTLDSLPPGKVSIKTAGDGESMEARIENRKLVYLRLNDREIPESELPDYESYVEKKLSEVPPAPPTPPAPPRPGMAPNPPTPPTPPTPPAPGKHKTVTVEVGEDGRAIVRTQEEEIKGIARRRSGAAEITIINGNDTTIVINADGIQFLDGAREIARELEHLFENGEQERHESRERLLERRAREMEGQARQMERQGRVIEQRMRETERNAEHLARELELSLAPDVHLLREMAPNRDFFPAVAGRGNVQAALENELLRDGLINDRNKYKMELSAGSLKVNGKKMPEGLAKKYKTIYEERSGISLESGGKVVVEK